MTYRVLGQGPPLILIPGIASTYRGYALTLNRLAERFRTILYDYPGRASRRRRQARAGSRHEHLVDDLFGLIDHLNLGRVFLVGLSFGSTITLRALHREPRRFPKAVVQGAFAHRRFTPAERLALVLGRLVPGHDVAAPPAQDGPDLQQQEPSSRRSWPTAGPTTSKQNGLTPIASLAHRLDLLARLDLRPILPAIPTEVLLLQGNEDRIVPRRYFDELQGRAARRPRG